MKHIISNLRKDFLANLFFVDKYNNDVIIWILLEGEIFMYMTRLDIMWQYLHDQSNCVDEYLFVTDPYRYTSAFVDMLVRNPEVIPQLKSKMHVERMNSGVFGLFMRDGYGLAEYRVIKMMRIDAFHDFLADEFPELINFEQGSKLSKNIR